MTFSRLMLYWPTVSWTILPPSLENLSSCATRSTPVEGCLSSEYDLMLSGMAVCSPRLSRKTYLQGVADGRVGERRPEEGHELVLLDHRLRLLRRLRFVGGVIAHLERDLCAVDPAGAVDLLDREQHAVPALWAVHAARSGDGQQGAELDGLALVGATAGTGSGATCRQHKGGEQSKDDAFALHLSTSP